MYQAQLKHNMEEMVMAFLVEMNATVTSLEVTVEHAMLENGVKQPTMDAVDKQYDDDLKEWKSGINAHGRRTTMEVMDALVTMMQNERQSDVDVEFLNDGQSNMDVTYQSGQQSDVDVGYPGGRQSEMDVTYKSERQSDVDVANKNSVQNKRNKQRARKRRLKLVGTDGGVLEGVDL